MSTPAERPQGSALLSVVAVVTLGALIAMFWWFFWGSPEPYSFFDINFYRTAVLEVMSGSKSMYDAMAYPPFAYLLLWWLGSTPPLLADQLWTAVTFAVTIAMAAVLSIRVMEVLGRPWRSMRAELVTRTAIGSLLLLASWPMVSQLTCGQLSLLVIALPFFDLAGLVPKRYEGVLVGLAAAIKVTPMIFAIYYLVTGQRRQAVNTVASFALWTGVGAIFFPSATWEFWTRLGRTGQDVDPLLPYNLGIRSMLARISLSLAQPTWLWAGLGLLLMVLALWRARVMYRRGDALEAAFVVAIAAIVVPPNSLPHYFTWLPLAAIWVFSTTGRLGKWLSVALLIIYAMVCSAVTFWIAGFAPQLATALASLGSLAPVVIGVLGLPRRLAGPTLAPVDEPASAGEAAVSPAGR